jgi:hypothetical protein
MTDQQVSEPIQRKPKRSRNSTGKKSDRPKLKWQIAGVIAAIAGVIVAIIGLAHELPPSNSRSQQPPTSPFATPSQVQFHVVDAHHRGVENVTMLAHNKQVMLRPDGYSGMVEATPGDEFTFSANGFAGATVKVTDQDIRDHSKEVALSR